MYGNKDKDREFEFDDKLKDHFVVKHFNNHPGSKDVDTNSINYQFYNPEVFEELSRIAKDGSNRLSRFGGQKNVVLHDPTKVKKTEAGATE